FGYAQMRSKPTRGEAGKGRGGMKIKMAVLAVLLAVTASTSAMAGTFKRQEVTVGTRKNMEATLFIPDGPGPFPSVLVMHTSFGITEADRGYCANLAREG